MRFFNLLTSGGLNSVGIDLLINHWQELLFPSCYYIRLRGLGNDKMKLHNTCFQIQVEKSRRGKTHSEGGNIPK